MKRVPARSIAALLLLSSAVLAGGPALPGGPALAASGADSPPSPAASPSAGASPSAVASPSADTSPSPATSPAIGPPEPDLPAPDFPALEAPEWTRLWSGEGPAAREDHTWTVGGDAAAAWLFGGRDGGRVFDDLWRFELATGTWTPIEPPGARPDARFGHGAAWVDGVGLVIFAGQRGADFFADLWAYDPAAGAWTELPDRGARPAPRYGSCASVGPDGRLWISHGFTFRGRFDDTRAYDFERGRWSDETPLGKRPPERCLHDCFWSTDGRLVLYAGQNNEQSSLGDLWALTPGGTWARLPDPRAPARRLYALTEAGPHAWILGGAARDGSVLDDLWRVDRLTLRWQRVVLEGARPAGRSAATLVTDAVAGRLLLFGGQGRSLRRADLWQLAEAPLDEDRS